MSARIRFEVGQVVKRPRGDPELLIHRTRVLVAAGVATLEAAPAPDPGDVAFPRLDGRGGRQVLAEDGPGALARLLAPVAALHRVRLDGLAAFDPAARIRPRLRPGDELSRAALQRALQHLAELEVRSNAVTAHGDFHLGQLLETADDAVWLLDLDDLSEGPPEADLGNFAAHLATTPGFDQGSFGEVVRRWLAEVCAAYPGAANRRLASAFQHLALLRRGVKLRARDGTPEVLIEAANLVLEGGLETDPSHQAP